MSLEAEVGNLVQWVVGALGLGGAGAGAVAMRRRRTVSDDPEVEAAVHEALQSQEIGTLGERVRDLERSVTHLEAELGTLRLDLIRKGTIPSGRTGKTFLGTPKED